MNIVEALKRSDTIQRKSEPKLVITATRGMDFLCNKESLLSDDWEPVEKQISIYKLLPLLKRGWIAMDSDNQWNWYEMKPVQSKDFWDGGDCFSFELYVAFNIAPFDGDWKDSLIEIK